MASKYLLLLLPTNNRFNSLLYPTNNRFNSLLYPTNNRFNSLLYPTNNRFNSLLYPTNNGSLYYFQTRKEDSPKTVFNKRALRSDPRAIRSRIIFVTSRKWSAATKQLFLHASTSRSIHILFSLVQHGGGPRHALSII